MQNGGAGPPSLYQTVCDHSCPTGDIGFRCDIVMAIAIREDVANYSPYNRLIERVLSEGRIALVWHCPGENCLRSLFVFHNANTKVEALRYNVHSLLGRTHPDHDSIYAINEYFPPEVSKLISYPRE